MDLPFEPGLDEVSHLSAIEILLWNAELCPGPPTRDYPGAIENAAYRLVALGVLDPTSAKIAPCRLTDLQDADPRVWQSLPTCGNRFRRYHERRRRGLEIRAAEGLDGSREFA